LLLLLLLPTLFPSAAAAAAAAAPSDAGEETADIALRTWPALRKTLAHLRKLLLNLGTPDWNSDRQAVFELLEAHRFLWDRYRGLRKDITQTELPQLVGAGVHGNAVVFGGGGCL